LEAIRWIVASLAIAAYQPINALLELPLSELGEYSNIVTEIHKKMKEAAT